MRRRRERIERARLAAGGALVAAAALLWMALQSGALLWVALALCGAGIAIWPRIPGRRRRRAQQVYDAANAEWKATLQQWRQEASEARFTKHRAALEKARADFVDLPNERVRRLQKLETNRELHQKLRYLDRFRIDAASVRGIGTGRTAMLEAYGVETAADVDEPSILQIPGFGPALASELVHWRHGHEANFRFNPAEPVDPKDIATVEREIERRRHELLELLRKGPDTLRQTSQAIVAARKELMPALEKAWTDFKMAEVEKNDL